MKIKRNNGFVGIDMTLSIIAIMIFSGLIVSLMYNNTLQNLKTRREALATIYLTETLENIGIAEYSQITEENINTYIPEEAEENGYNIEITFTEDKNLSTNQGEDIIKKITATISYKVVDKDYKLSMERTKIKE